MSNMSSPVVYLFIHIIFAILCCPVLLICPSEAKVVPEFPGREAFKRLDALLQNRGLKVDDVDGNLKLIDQLEQGSEMGPKVIDAARYITALKFTETEKICNFGTFNLVKLNTIGAYHDDASLKFDISLHMKESRLANIITHVLRRLLLICHDEISEGYTSRDVEQFLDSQFVDSYNESSSNPEPRLGLMDSSMFSSPRNFDRLSYPLLLDRLFKQAKEEFQGFKGRRVKVKFGLRTYEWYLVEQGWLQHCTMKYILKPCEKFASATKHDVLLLYYYARDRFAFATEEPDYANLLVRKDAKLKYHLFRYEFCHKYGGESFWTNLWNRYMPIMGVD